ncbi:MAG: CDP-glycerol glycerophosphotransferase family protein, partial [Erysipelotrichaceae bacterium]|nr:CDP-glycerol glycerophosphotransferase family protein [Erysipelotrichaceae bacterium]
TWHAAVGFKAIGYSRYGKESSPFPIACCHKRYTYAVVATEKLVDIYAERFGLSKERFLPYGMPRLDHFLDADVIGSTKQKVYETYPFLRDKKVILFAPTYRGANQKSAYYPYEKLDYGRIDDYCRKHNAVFFMKMHPFVKNGVVIPEEYKDTIVNGSDYQNINDLYYVSDIMITDYSSCFYEYSLLKRPVLFYTYDRNVYELTRGVHADVAETAPGKVCDTFEELMEALETEDYDLDKTRKFVEDNFGDYAGGSSRKIIEHVILGKDQR